MTVINGTGADDTLSGGSLADTISGFGGNDTLHGAGGADTLYGGDGDDRLVGDTNIYAISTGKLFGGAGNDTLTGAGGVDTLDGGDGNDTLTAIGGGDTLLGGAGDDVLVQSGSNYIAGGAGNDTYFMKDGSGSLVENPGEGIDTKIVDPSFSALFTLSSTMENLTLVGTLAADASGSSTSNIIIGNSAANTITGKEGDDTLSGGLGDDVYVFASSDGHDTVTDTGGSDTLYFDATVDIASISSVQSGNNLLVSYGAAGSTVTVVDYFSSPADEVELLFPFNSLNITASGTSGNDYLQGQEGYDLLSGLDGDDTIDGAAGLDELHGDDGNDTINGGNDTDKLYGGAGNDKLDGGSGADTQYGGDGDDTLTGGLYSGDTLLGGNGNDVLIQGFGNHYIAGGPGDDIYVGNNGGGTVDEAIGEGNDTIILNAYYADNFGLSFNYELENLILIGDVPANLNGNNLNNIIIGNAAANTISGMGGNDTLAGGGGNDVYLFSNSAGQDTIVNASGTDTLRFDATVSKSSLVYLRSGDDLLINYGTLGSSVRIAGYFSSDSIGSEQITSSSNSVLPVSLSGTLGSDYIQGTGGNEALLGLSGDDTIDGGSGSDLLAGGAGNDTYFVDNTGDLVQDASGFDIVISSISWILASGLESLVLTDNSANGVGNSGINVITGNDGNNMLDGKSGADTLVGGLGDDTYAVDAAADFIDEETGEGDADTVLSLISYILAGNLENLLLTGTRSVSATGNDVANVLTGNGGANTLNGGAGCDSMSGGAGGDTYIVDDTGDVVTETTVGSAGGTDTVKSSICFSLGLNLEKLTLTGTGNIDGTGNGLNNVITGNSGDNVLDGGAGVDKLVGGLGNDTYFVDLVNRSGVARLEDAVAEGSAAGSDTLILRAAGDLGLLVPTTLTLASTFENVDASLTGSNKINLVGNSANNALTGNDWGNTISGALGNDTLDGGGGDDTVVGGDGNDRILADIRGDIFVSGVRQESDVLTGSAGNDTLVVHLTYDQGQDAGITAAVAAVQAAITGGNVIPFTSAELGITITGFEAIETVVDAVPPVNHAPTEVDLGNLSLNEGTSGAVVGTLTVTDQDVGDVHDFSVDDARFEVVIGNLRLKAGQTLDYETEPSVTISITATDQGNLGYSELFTVTVNDLPETQLFSTGDDAIDMNAVSAGSYLPASFYDALAGADVVALPGTSQAAALGYDASSTFSGGDGNDTITGDALNDLIDGGAGADKLAGGSGNDTFFVDSSSDSVAGGSGADVIFSAVSWSLNSASPDVESLILTGTAEIGGFGRNGANDYLRGNDSGLSQLFAGSGNDTLESGGAACAMSGGPGDDIYVVHYAGDTPGEQVDSGIDTVYSSITFTLSSSSYIEYLVLTGTDAINGAAPGGGNDKILWGNSAANTLSGGVLNDTLDGGDGLDRLFGDFGADTFVLRVATAYNDTDVFADFSTSQGDKIDISDLLTAYSPGSMSLTSFVQITDSGPDSLLSVDRDGTGLTYGFEQIALIVGVTGLTDETALVTNGSLIIG